MASVLKEESIYRARKIKLYRTENVFVIQTRLNQTIIVFYVYKKLL